MFCYFNSFWFLGWTVKSWSLQHEEDRCASTKRKLRVARNTSRQAAILRGVKKAIGAHFDWIFFGAEKVSNNNACLQIADVVAFLNFTRTKVLYVRHCMVIQVLPICPGSIHCTRLLKKIICALVFTGATCMNTIRNYEILPTSTAFHWCILDKNLTWPLVPVLSTVFHAHFT